MEEKKAMRPEIGYTLFLDIVGYSSRRITEQHEWIERLTSMVVNSDEFRTAKEAGKVICLPTGDGVAIVFLTAPDAPALCAIQIAEAALEFRIEASREHRQGFDLRMGIHSGPVVRIVDINGLQNVAGAGINLAQRVMDCGDVGHILLSEHIADDLRDYPMGEVRMSNLGKCEVKHGRQVSIVNLWTHRVGNLRLPKKFAINLYNSLSEVQKTVFKLLAATGAGPYHQETRLRAGMPPDASDLEEVLESLQKLDLAWSAPGGLWQLTNPGDHVARCVALRQ